MADDREVPKTVTLVWEDGWSLTISGDDFLLAQNYETDACSFGLLHWIASLRRTSKETNGTE